MQKIESKRNRKIAEGIQGLRRRRLRSLLNANEEAAFKRNAEYTRYFAIYLDSVRCASIKYFCDFKRFRLWSTIVLVSLRIVR